MKIQNYTHSSPSNKINNIAFGFKPSGRNDVLMRRLNATTERIHRGGSALSENDPTAARKHFARAIENANRTVDTASKLDSPTTRTYYRSIATNHLKSAAEGFYHSAFPQFRTSR